MEGTENNACNVRVKSGQLRRWKDDGSGETFLVLERDPDFTNDPFWRVLLNSGDTKLWSQTRIKGWSEVISEPR